VTKPLEGERRPGHFRGVTTVVLKLLNAVGPDRAYFGRKDAQQLRVVDRMVRDLDLGVEIVPCEIVREPDGLAMSSRNVYLSPEHRSAAPIIYQALCAARREFEHGERDADRLRFIAAETISRVPGAQIDYVSLADDATLDELEGTVDARALLSVVVRFGHTRLLDNIELG
jgi:pantoate--beta-alanine ligase